MMVDVETLRVVAGNHGVRVCDEAADEIEMLRYQRDRLAVMLRRTYPRALKADHEAARVLLAEVEASK